MSGGLLTGWMNDMKGWMNRRMNEWKDECIEEYMSGRMNEWYGRMNA